MLDRLRKVPIYKSTVGGNCFVFRKGEKHEKTCGITLSGSICCRNAGVQAEGEDNTGCVKEAAHNGTRQGHTTDDRAGSASSNDPGAQPGHTASSRASRSGSRASRSGSRASRSGSSDSAST